MNRRTKSLFVAVLLVPWLNAYADGHTSSPPAGMDDGSKSMAADVKPRVKSVSKTNTSSGGRAGVVKPAPRTSPIRAAKAGSTSADEQLSKSERTQEYLAKIRSLEIELEEARSGKGIPGNSDAVARRHQDQLKAARHQIAALKARTHKLTQKAEENKYFHEELSELRGEVVRLRSLVNKSTSELDQAEAGLAGIQQGIKDIQNALTGARLELSKDPDNVMQRNDKHHSGRTARRGRYLEARGQEIAITNSENRRHR